MVGDGRWKTLANVQKEREEGRGIQGGERRGRRKEEREMDR